MSKISAYPDGGAIQATDKLVIARAGANKSITGDKVQATCLTTIYTAGSGNHVPAANTRFMEVELVGPGGGGGGADGGAGSSGCGGGGSGGGYVRKKYDAPLAASYAYAVGAGGTGGAAGNNAGNPGTADTTFGTLTGSKGNGGGSMATGSTAFTFANANLGGAAAGGDVNIPGGVGNPGIRYSASVVLPGVGGDSQLGAGGRPPVTSDAVGANGLGYGSGGAGAGANSATDRAGGAGANGVIIVREYT